MPWITNASLVLFRIKFAEACGVIVENTHCPPVHTSTLLITFILISLLVVDGFIMPTDVWRLNWDNSR